MKSFVIYGLTFLVGVFILFNAPIDPDFGWHYKLGEYTVTHLQLQKQNTLSFMFPEYDWSNSYWLSQIPLYLSYTYLGGWSTSLLLGSLFIGILMFLMIKVQSHRLVIPFLLVITYQLLTTFNITMRPMIFSSIFFILLIYVLWLKPCFEKWLPLLFLIWANVHADWVPGLFIYAVFNLQRIFLFCKRNGFDFKKDIRTLGFYIGFPFLSVFLTLLNPFGLGLWKTFLAEGNPYQFTIISEWVPLFYTDMNAFYFHVFGLVLFLGGLWVFRKEIPLWLLSACFFYGLLSLRLIYFGRISFLISLLPLTYYWGKGLKPLDSLLVSKGSVRIFRVYVLTLGVIALSLYIRFLPLFNDSKDISTWSFARETHKYPYNAVQYMKNNNIRGRVFNKFEWGGYLILTYPENKTFIDGRMTSWNVNGYSLLREVVQIEQHWDDNKDNFFRLVEDHQLEYVLYPTSGNLVKSLMKDYGWEVIYTDEIATLIKVPDSLKVVK